MNTQQLSTIPNAAANGQPDDAIRTQQLVKVYKTAAGDYTALKGIDLSVQHGEFVAVLGKSGAGKSTMINLITGIDRPTSGEIVVNGTAIHHLHEDQRARCTCSTRWASPSTLTRSRHAFRAGSSSAWRLRARWPTIRRSSLPTSR